MPRPRVLLATNDPDAVGAICGTLTAEGYDVDTVGRGADAISRYAQEHYDLLIASVQLPDLDARDLYFMLRARWPADYPRMMLLVPAGSPLPPPAPGRLRPAAPTLAVPCPPEALREMVRRLLGVL